MVTRGLYSYLIFTQKIVNRAKKGVLHGTPKIFLKVSQDVFTMHNTQSTKINQKINFILHGLATQRLSVKKKSDTKQPFFPPCRNWYAQDELFAEKRNLQNANFTVYKVYGNLKRSCQGCNIQVWRSPLPRCHPASQQGGWGRWKPGWRSLGEDGGVRFSVTFLCLIADSVWCVDYFQYLWVLETGWRPKVLAYGIKLKNISAFSCS